VVPAMVAHAIPPIAFHLGDGRLTSGTGQRYGDFTHSASRIDFKLPRFV
jgi:hypothetical protein